MLTQKARLQTSLAMCEECDAECVLPLFVERFEVHHLLAYADVC